MPNDQSERELANAIDALHAIALFQRHWPVGTTEFHNRQIDICNLLKSKGGLGQAIAIALKVAYVAPARRAESYREIADMIDSRGELTSDL
jgi:hypothetical protein